MVVITFYAWKSGGINNRNRFPGGLYRPWACRRSPFENVPIINLLRSQCSARMQRTSTACYFAYNDAAVHANARNHPGDDIKRDRRRHPPGGDSRRRSSLTFLPVPDTKKERRKEEEKGSPIFPRETATEEVVKKSGK